jgi:undecaprenyl-diphosphatase
MLHPANPATVLDRLIGLVGDLGHGGYLVIFLVVALESAAFLGFFMPGETLVFLGGFLVSQGVLAFWDLIVLVAVAAILGDSIGYELGRWLGREWLLRYGRFIGLKEAHLDRVDCFFRRHGGKTIFFARFSAFFRIMVPYLAGVSRFRYPRFLLFNALGGISWAAASVLVGYLAGESWHVVQHWLGRAGAIAAMIAILVIVVVRLARWPSPH